MIKFTEWKSATNDLPTEDGDYLILRFDSEGRCYSGSTMSFVVGVGWNVHRLEDGELSDKHKIVYDEAENAVWAKVCEEKE